MENFYKKFLGATPIRHPHPWTAEANDEPSSTAYNKPAAAPHRNESALLLKMASQQDLPCLKTDNTDHTLASDTDSTIANMQVKESKNEPCIFCSSHAHQSIACCKFSSALARRTELIRKCLCIDCFLDGRHASCPMLQLKPCTFCTENGRWQALTHSALFCEFGFPDDGADHAEKASVGLGKQGSLQGEASH